MKAVIINSYGGAEVLHYADIETPQIKSDQQRLSPKLQLLRSRIQQQSNSSVYAHILIRIRKRFCKFIASACERLLVSPPPRGFNWRTYPPTDTRHRGNSVHPMDKISRMETYSYESQPAQFAFSGSIWPLTDF